MKRLLIAALGLVFALSVTPLEAQSSRNINVNINIGPGTSLNFGRGISCSDGARILRNRGFSNVRAIDCRGRNFVYRANRGNGRFEVAVRARDGRVLDVRRIGRR
jgi:hypothetical protein